ncbi:MAG: adenylate/guanylate cyclase domain-containing protein [Chthoniobacterales bacterium]
MAAKHLRRSFWLAGICGGIGLLVIAFYWSQFVTIAVLGPRLGNQPTFIRLYTFWRHVFPDILVSWENSTNDRFVRIGKKAPVTDQLVAIGIDDASTSINEIDLQDFAGEMDPAGSDYRALELMTHPWPWSREVHALVLDKLVRAGAKVVVFDLVFGSETTADPGFRLMLEKYRDHVVVGSNFDKLIKPDGQQTWTQTMPSDSLIPQTTPVDDRVGFVNYSGELDGVVRSALFRTTLEIYNGYRFEPGQEIYQSLAARTLAKAGLADKIPHGLGDYPIHFAEPNTPRLRPRPIYQLFVPRYWSRNFKDGAVFKDKIVIIGPYARVMHDEMRTPFDAVPGPHMHLQVLNAALKNGFVTRISSWAATLLIALAAALAFAISCVFHKPVRQFLSLLAGSGGFVGLSWIFYNEFHCYPITIAPLLALNGGGIVSIVYQFVVEQLERARTRRTLERYVSRNLVSELLDNPGEFMGVKRTPVTVLFSDLRGFTSMTENADAAQLVVQLNEYLTEMVKCVFAHDGTLDKFIGDAVMAVWGNVKSHGNAEDARRAVLSALDMRVALKKLNERWRAAGLPEFRFGIGLNHGEVIRGDIGSPEKSEFTVIGDPINLASRMEGLTKNYGIDILIGEDVAGLVRDRFVLQSIDRVRVKGKGAPTEVFAVHQPSDAPMPPKLASYLDRFGDAIHLYRAGQFIESLIHFTETLLENPGDPVCELYLSRCEAFMANPPGPDWDGVFTMKTK